MEGSIIYIFSFLSLVSINLSHHKYMNVRLNLLENEEEFLMPARLYND